MRWRFVAFAVSLALIVLTIGSLAVRGLNLGIDFEGGLLLEVRADQPVDIGAMRQQLEALDVGAVQLQEFGEPTDMLIRVELPEEGGEDAQQVLVDKIRTSLGEGYEYRRIEFVGPSIGSELLRDGLIATSLAILAIALYVAFRFEWQFGVSALIATLHDVVLTIGLYSALGLEFDMTAIAALLTLAGYSINDTVVVFDRIREMMRRYKSADLKTLINLSVNSTLSRTVLTGGTTLVAILALLFFGGSTLFNFSLALAWGIVIGTISSVFVAGSLLLYMPPVGTGARASSQTGGSPGAASPAEPRS
ncbi:MAG TPA: protein translocase subunit SecF [Alphaproteobacteria bacterium]|nr:protein translocase subunit SecF [Alphaproteobacteria bacterium]